MSDKLNSIMSGFESQAERFTENQDFDKPNELSQEEHDEFKQDLDLIRGSMDQDPDELAKAMHRHFEQVQRVPALRELYGDPNDISAIIAKMRAMCSDKYRRHQLNKTARQKKQEAKSNSAALIGSIFG